MKRTFGNLDLVPGNPRRWHLTNLPPHVAIAFKRLFPKVPTHSIALTLVDGDETRADLLWFTQRYPLETTVQHELEAGAARVEARMAERDRILMPDWSPGEVPGFRPGYAPYLYQSQAAQIALNNGGLLLGDDVGLGKTISAITLLCMGAPMPAGVVVQTHLADQWAKKIREFSTLRTHVIKGTKPYKLPPADVYIFRYSNVAGWIDYLKDGFLKTIIYDEIQELRRGDDSEKGRACAIVSARALIRLGLTATPIYNYGDEMHTIMSYIVSDLLGDRAEFLREWCGGGAQQLKDPDALGAFLRDSGWFLRRDEDDPSVDRSMPPPNKLDCCVAWDSGAVEDEEELLRTLAQSVMSGDFMEAGSASRQLDLKMRMMTGIAKARAVAAYVRMLLRGGTERVLLAGWHREVYAIWERELAMFEPVKYTGSENPAAKKFSVDQFTTGNSRVMMISLRSGAGLDGLQHYCRDVVFGELDWSPQVHHQVAGRLRRPGQMEQINTHTLWTDQGSDPVLIEMLGVKSDQSRGVTAPGAIPAAKFSDDSRIKRLAKFVLEGEVAAARSCDFCSNGALPDQVYIVPLDAADDMEPGPERDALFGPDNRAWVCDEHAQRLIEWRQQNG